jgi:hypothetical protein
MSNNSRDTTITFDTQVCTFPASSDRLSSIGARDIIERVEINTSKKIFSKDKKNYVYEYPNIKNVRVESDKIRVGSSVSIDHNEIVNAEYVKNRRLDPGLSWKNDNAKYLRLVVDKNPTCEDDYEQRENFYYIYLLDKNNAYKRTKSIHHTSMRVKDEISASTQDLKRTAKKIKQKSDNLASELTVLNDWVMKSGKLRIEGVDKGSSITGGTISGNTRSTGSSKGAQLGQFTKGKSTSQGSFEGNISTTTSDNTFTSKIELFVIGGNGIYIKSDPNINVGYSDIDRIARGDDGIFIEIGQQTYSISGAYNNVSFSDLGGSFSAVRRKIKNTNNAEKNSTEENNSSSESKPTEQINELKKLYDNGAITEEEFNEKKKELLDKI